MDLLRKWQLIIASVFLLISFSTESSNGNGTEPPGTYVFVEVSTKKGLCESFPKIHWAGTGKVIPGATSKYFRFHSQVDNASTEECRVGVPSVEFDKQFKFCSLSGVLTTRPSSVNSCNFSKSRDSSLYRFFAKFSADSKGICKFVCLTR